MKILYLRCTGMGRMGGLRVVVVGTQLLFIVHGTDILTLGFVWYRTFCR
jgi:hypothetical protein